MKLESNTNMLPQNISIFTIVSNNYLHFARTLLQTVRLHHPEASLFCVIVDKETKPAKDYAQEFSIIAIDELGIPELESFKFQYNVLELNTAVKPWAIETLISRGFDSVIYLDPDIYLYQPMTEVIDLLKDQADIVITPHLLAPVCDNRRPTELDIRRAGCYNFGFCAVRNSNITSKFLKWWQSKLLRHCIIDMDHGIFVDQSWIDLVPGMFDRVAILRHPGYNVAYWNIAERRITRGVDGAWMSEGQPLVFFHFSGFDPFKPVAFSKHQNRFTLPTLGAAKELVENYAKTLINNGAVEFSKIPYGFGFFNDGVSIPQGFGRLYLQNEGLRRAMGINPFDQSQALLWEADQTDQKPLQVTWAMYAVWLGRKDLQQTFSLEDVASIEQYWDWFLSHGSNHVSPVVLAQHKSRWAEISSTDNATDLIHEIYMTILGRNPGPRGLHYTSKLGSNRLGATLVITALCLMPENRARGQQTTRALSALRSVWKRTPKYKKLIKHKPTAKIVSVEGNKLYMSGFYAADVESRTHGLWCGPSIELPLPNEPFKRVRISGHCPVALHESASSCNEVVITLKLDGQEWTQATVSKDGVVEISFCVPEQYSNARSLQINTSSSFVPRNIGLNTDSRELSWRVKVVSVDDVVLVDSARDTPFERAARFISPAGFNLVGYLSAELGVGEAARTMASAAKAAEVPYSILDVSYQSSNRQMDRRAWSNAVEREFDIDMIYVNADQVSNTLDYLRSVKSREALYRIGFWHWEQPRLPEAFFNGFDGINEVWVPTAFVHDAIAAVSPVPVFKVPHAVDFVVNPKWTREYFGIPENTFAVLVMYDFHSYRYRKNPEAAIAAFKMATFGRTDASLVIKTMNASHYCDDYLALKAEVEGLPHVRLIDEVYTREQIYSLEACCDCMLSLHRAEGFGFGPAEMMYLGKPVIATGWSGNMEFMTPSNSFPVEYELRPLLEPVGVYSAGYDWAEPNIEHAAQCLRSLLDDPALAKKVGVRAESTMKTRFNPYVIGQQYRERLSLIRARNREL